jgi:hypothetical protein
MRLAARVALVVVAAGGVVSPPALRAYPIDPVPLWDLIAQSAVRPLLD